MLSGLGLTHGVADGIHFSVYGSEGGQLCRAAGQAAVQLIICGYLIVRPLQVLLILQNKQSINKAINHSMQQHLRFEQHLRANTQSSI